MNRNSNYSDLFEEYRKVRAKGIICEHVSKKLTETLLHVETKMKRELSTDEIENILIMLTDDNDN
jgi:uncharacterized protein YbgA (DUF1722 family)